jgi:hypothetical protein
MSHQRLAPDEREVYGVVEPNQFQNARHESLSTQVAQLTKRDATTKMLILLSPRAINPCTTRCRGAALRCHC